MLGRDKGKWAAFTTLFEAGRRHIKASHPKLPVGVTVMYDGLTGGSAAQAARLNKSADVVLLTYYPLAADFRIRPVSHLDEVFRELTKRYPKRPIHFGEIGCPSGEVLGSSLEHQAAFVRRLFRLWDRHAARVPMISYCWLTDTSKASLDIYAKYYGSSHPRFLGYLATLGLRHRAGHGTDKPAMIALREEARKRAFPVRAR